MTCLALTATLPVGISTAARQPQQIAAKGLLPEKLKASVGIPAPLIITVVSEVTWI